MDVRCAQCQAEYELDDTLVAERGTLVCCTRCGFRFRAYRPAGALPAPERWTVRTASGVTLTFRSLRELQEAIVLRHVGAHDALTRGQGPARSLASIVEFRPLFEAAKRGDEAPGRARPSMPTPAGLGGPPVATRAEGGGGEAPASVAAAAPRAEGVVGGEAPAAVAAAAPRRTSTLRALSPRQTLGYDDDDEARAAVREARAAGGDGAGAWRAARPGGAVYPPGAASSFAGEDTAPLFVGRLPGVARPGGPGYSMRPRGGGRAPPAREPERDEGGEGGERVSAATPQAFVASDVVTPPEGSSRPPAPSGGAAGPRWRTAGPSAGPGTLGAGRDSIARGGPAPGGGAGSRPPVAARAPAGSSLRWFVAAAAFAALAGAALRNVRAPAEAAAARALASRVDELLASGDAALAGGDPDAALEAYAKAKGLARDDARVAAGAARAAVLRADVLWWRRRVRPSAPAPADDGLAEAAAGAARAVDDARRLAPGDGRVLAWRLDAARLTGEVAAARALASADEAAPAGPDGAYAWAALRLAEGAPPDGELLARLRRAAAAEAAPGRAAAALAYGLGLAGEARAARAELDRLAAVPKPFGALPELRAWLDARAAAAGDGGAAADGPARRPGGPSVDEAPRGPGEPGPKPTHPRRRRRRPVSPP